MCRCVCARGRGLAKSEMEGVRCKTYRALKVAHISRYGVKRNKVNVRIDIKVNIFTCLFFKSFCNEVYFLNKKYFICQAVG